MIYNFRNWSLWILDRRFVWGVYYRRNNYLPLASLHRNSTPGECYNSLDTERFQLYYIFNSLGCTHGGYTGKKIAHHFENTSITQFIKFCVNDAQTSQSKKRVFENKFRSGLTLFSSWDLLRTQNKFNTQYFRKLSYSWMFNAVCKKNRKALTCEYLSFYVNRLKLEKFAQ